MTGTRVSVIIPTYNRQHKIGAAIRSVLQQTFRDFELIVVDDASTDGTLDILDEFKDKRIRVVRHTRNSGSSQARNTGLNSSRSKYIAFLDSDDEWMEDKLFLQMEALEKFPDDIVANVCGYLLHDEFGIERKMIPPHPGSWHKLLIMGCGLGEGSTLVVNRQAFEQVGFLDVTFPRYADWEWLLRFTRQYPIITTPEILAVVHRDETPSAKKVEIAAGRFLEKHINDFSTYGSYGKRAIGKRYLEIAINYFIEKNNKEGWKWFRKAVSQSLFLRPGMYLRVLDALVGTSIVPTLIRVREH